MPSVCLTSILMSRALKMCEKLLEINPNHAFEVVQTLNNMKKYTVSLRLFSQRTKTNPNFCAIFWKFIRKSLIKITHFFRFIKYILLCLLFETQEFFQKSALKLLFLPIWDIYRELIVFQNRFWICMWNSFIYLEILLL